MPKPKKDESKKQYIRRCMRDLIGRENRSPEQARLLCEKYWKQHKNKNSALFNFPPLNIDDII